jgi:Flp pilus assembly protein TadD
MTRHGIARAVIGALVVAVVWSAAPAFAQATGSVRGQVVDEAGKPVPEAEVVMEFTDDPRIGMMVKANTRGEFNRGGLRPGAWVIQAQKGKMVGAVRTTVTPSNVTELGTITIKIPAPPSAAVAEAVAAGVTNDELAERAKAMEAAKADFEAGAALLDSNPDEAIKKFQAVIARVPQCGLCYTRVGDAHLRKQDEAAAETAYRKAIEVDPAGVDAYAALASLFNRQKKFDEAAKMSAKANELREAAGEGSAADVLNQGIIHWNAGEFPEAKAQFARAVALDPKLADAYYRLGMANVNLGQLPDAVKAFEEYLKLAPEGEHAAITRELLKSIKGGAPQA